MLQRRSLSLFVFLLITLIVVKDVESVATTTKPSKINESSVTTSKPNKKSVKENSTKIIEEKDEDLRYTPDELASEKSKFILSCKQPNFCKKILGELGLGLKTCDTICEMTWNLAEQFKKKKKDLLIHTPEYIPEPEPKDIIDETGEITNKGPTLGISGFKSKKNKDSKDKNSKEKGNKKEETDTTKSPKSDSEKQTTKSKLTTAKPK